jgi:hypothetical protein
MAKRQKATYASLDRAFKYSGNVKPQTSFEVKPDNTYNGPWKPLLTVKPHATIPLEQSLSLSNDEIGQQQYDYIDYLPLCIIPSCELVCQEC